jgi:hypothetical protein
MLLVAVVQGHPSTFEAARGLFVEFPIYNCDPERLMVNQLSEILREFGAATHKLKRRIGFANDQVSLVSILYAKTDLNLLRLSKNLTERQEQYRHMLHEFYLQQGPSSPAHTERLQDDFRRLTQLEFGKIQRQHQKRSMEILASMAFSISQRMEEDLEAEDLNFRALLTHFLKLPLGSTSE